jgi:hypothetical protein
MCKLLGVEKDPDSVLAMPDFKETILFYDVKVSIWTERHANRRTYRARNWPVGFEEEKYVPWQT